MSRGKEPNAGHPVTQYNYYVRTRLASVEDKRAQGFGFIPGTGSFFENRNVNRREEKNTEEIKSLPDGT